MSLRRSTLSFTLMVWCAAAAAGRLYAQAISGAGATNPSVAPPSRAAAPAAAPPSIEGVKPILDFETSLLELARHHQETLEHETKRYEESLDAQSKWTLYGGGALAVIACVLGGVVTFFQWKSKDEVRRQLDENRRQLDEQAGRNREEIQGQRKECLAELKEQRDEIRLRAKELFRAHFEQTWDQEIQLLTTTLQVLETEGKLTNALSLVLTALNVRATDPKSPEIPQAAERHARACLKLNGSPEKTRHVGILLGRLLEDEEKGYEQSISALTDYIQIWSDFKKKEDVHLAALYFNRACYRNRAADRLLRPPSLNTAAAGPLREKALKDLEEFCRLDDDYDAALKDGDLKSLWQALVDEKKALDVDAARRLVIAPKVDLSKKVPG